MIDTEIYCLSMGDCISVIFFFQAEDGIRDLVRSRGLGDVYKRQTYNDVELDAKKHNQISHFEIPEEGYVLHPHVFYPVSYTHLTLPTSDLV